VDRFRKKLINRLILILIGLLIFCIAVIFSYNFEKAATSSEILWGFADGFQFGTTAYLIGVLLVFTVRYLFVIHSPDRLKKLYISETDERRMFIKQKTGGLCMNIISYGLMAGTAVMGNINDTAFLSLLGSCLLVAIVRGFFKIYYRYKY
jgi:uncharacterized membrane protein